MRQRKDFKRIEGIRSGRLVVIAAEGKETENIYFEAMKTMMHASDVHVKVLRRENNESSPENVFQQMQEFAKEYDIDDDDQLWIVIDRDKWKEKTLKIIAQKCQQNKYYNFCVSNPCFELWLILHLEDVTQYTDEEIKLLKENKKVNNTDTWTKMRLRTLMSSYHEAKYDVNLLLPKISDAITRAKQMDTKPKSRWPQTLGTRVYRLANSIMGNIN